MLDRWWVSGERISIERGVLGPLSFKEWPNVIFQPEKLKWDKARGSRFVLSEGTEPRRVERDKTDTASNSLSPLFPYLFVFSGFNSLSSLFHSRSDCVCQQIWVQQSTEAVIVKLGQACAGNYDIRDLCLRDVWEWHCLLYSHDLSGLLKNPPYLVL